MDPKRELIIKLFEGDCSKEELELLLDLIRDGNEEEDTEVMESLWQALKSYPDVEKTQSEYLLQELFKRIEEKEAASPQVAVSSRLPGRILIRRRQYLRFVSAAVVLLLLGSISWFWFDGKKSVVIQTAYAQQKMVVLPDQSQVKLNANSTLSFYKNWKNDEVRKVWLTGEAYFEVEKTQRADNKFQVITDDLKVEVLGTVFNVNARSIATEVFLEE